MFSVKGNCEIGSSTTFDI